MKKILLATLTVLALSPALLFARHGDGTEVEVHKSSGHSGVVMSGATMSGSHNGWHHGTGSTGSGWTSSGRTNTGKLIEANLKALHADMSKLTPEQKVELTAMIRTYLTSKGITPTVPTMNDDAKKALKEAAKAKREAQKNAMKAKREAQKAARNDFNSSRSNREKGN
jgi:hypothetical protein